MTQAYLWLRSGIIWVVSLAHFAAGTLLALLVSLFVDSRRSDPLQRLLARNIVRLAGVQLRVVRGPGFDPSRTSIFVSNHVDIFDPFVLYSAIPQYVRGWELESHFKIPIYGWMMNRFGNVPVPDRKGAGGLRRLVERTKQALDSGTSLIVFAEGGRTSDGRVGPFQTGIFRMLRGLDYPLVPVSMVGSFEFCRKGSYLLRPSTIVVHLHDTIETKGLTEKEREALCERVYQIVSAPVDAFLGVITPKEPAVRSDPRLS